MESTVIAVGGVGVGGGELTVSVSVVMGNYRRHGSCCNDANCGWYGSS